MKKHRIEKLYILIVCLSFLIGSAILVNKFNESLSMNEGLGFIVYFNELPKDKGDKVSINFTIENYIKEDTDFRYEIYLDNKLLVRKDVVLDLKKDIFTKPGVIYESIKKEVPEDSPSLVKIRVRKEGTIKKKYYFYK